MVMGHAFMAEMELVVVRISVDLSCWYAKVQIVEKILNRREQRKEPLGNFFRYQCPARKPISDFDFRIK